IAFSGGYRYCFFGVGSPPLADLAHCGGAAAVKPPFEMGVGNFRCGFPGKSVYEQIPDRPFKPWNAGGKACAEEFTTISANGKKHRTESLWLLKEQGRLERPLS
ncbi:MAG: hypothetical protein SOI60_12470, partial [Lachnospiraceae bacterium]